MDRLLQRGALDKGLGWWLEPVPMGCEHLSGDAHRLEQVLINLLGNAIKFTDRGEVRLRLQVSSATAASVRLRFEISDSGIGIAPDALPRLFQPFSQADTSLSRRHGGTGLGLVISRRLVEQMGGELGVTSEPGQGSNFWFELPFTREVGVPGAGMGGSGPIPPVTPAVAGLRVLVVDDNRINQRMIEQALVRKGARVTLAGEGAEALRALRASPGGFDLVLMDIQMPVMDGLEATREIRRDPLLASLPVIALSAGVLVEERTAALDAGMDDFMEPVNLRQLQAVLDQHARRSERREHTKTTNI